MSEQKSTARVYACGGLATNILARSLKDEPVQGVALADVGFIDTSRSNMTADMNDTNFYEVYRDKPGDLDGSGGVRATNAAEIVKHADPAIGKFKPSWFNIVVGSAGGGSGSVIAPVIAGKLLQKGENVVLVLVGSRASSQRAESTVKTIQTAEAQATAAGRPLVVVYIDAPFDKSRAEVDKMVAREIGRLLVLASRNYRELDTKDISNFLDYSRVPACAHLPKMLVLLSTMTDAEIDKFQDPIISIASIYKTEDAKPHGKIVAYDTHGYGSAPGAGESALHYVLSTDRLAHIYRELDGLSVKAKSEMTERVIRDTIVKNVEVNPNGLVL